MRESSEERALFFRKGANPDPLTSQTTHAALPGGAISLLGGRFFSQQTNKIRQCRRPPRALGRSRRSEPPGPNLRPKSRRPLAAPCDNLPTQRPRSGDDDSLNRLLPQAGPSREPRRMPPEPPEGGREPRLVFASVCAYGYASRIPASLASSLPPSPS